MASMAIVNRKMAVCVAVERKMETQSTADFFTWEDRRELIAQGVKLDLMLQGNEEARRTAQEVERRLRSLEDGRLALQVSWKWIVFLASTISGGVSFVLHFIWK